MTLTNSQLYRALAFFCFFILRMSAANAQMVQKLDSLFDALEKKGRINGCVLIAEDGKPTYQKAFGYADVNTRQPLDNNTMFELASISKQFTAMAIMQLHQAGKLNYNDKVSKFFPKLKVYQSVTIDHLLHHTSGFPEFLGWAKEEGIDPNKVNDNHDLLNALTKKMPYLLYKPGDIMAYNNLNYVLLALIVEKVSGMPFDKYLNKNIFKPLGMDHTLTIGQLAARKKLPNYALGYNYDPIKGRFAQNDSLPGNKFEQTFDAVIGPYGISSTTGDLLKWDQALYTEKLISKQEQALAYAPAKLNNGGVAMLGRAVYGFGWFYGEPQPYSGVAYTHTGNWPGYQNIIVRYPEKNKLIIVLTNKDNAVYINALAEAVEHIVFGQPSVAPGAPPQRSSVPVIAQQLETFVGTYVLKDRPSIKYKVSAGEGRLFIQVTQNRKIAVYYDSPLTFFYDASTLQAKFERGDDGKINKLSIVQNGKALAEAIKQ